jgi:hypothetical protein
MIRLDSHSGPRVAWCFHKLLAMVLLIAFWSLGSQILVLVGSRGLVPVTDWLGTTPGLGFSNAPTLFWLGASDGWLVGGTVIGALCALAALFGLAPRVALALGAVVYLSYVSVTRSFLAFQWDNLLLEALALALLLPDAPRDTRRGARGAAPFAHLLFRILLFKLYFESGIAKYQSHLGDWIDGSAMRYYYETAPLPTRFAWTAHHLPAWWHGFESRATLVLELAVPFGIFGPRKLRLAALALLTGFQLVNLATANYGFFVYLALALHVFVLDDSDVLRARRALGKQPRVRRALAWLRVARRRIPRLPSPALPVAAVIAVGAFYVGVSSAQALVRFNPEARKSETLRDVANLLGPYRLINTYHLFGHITRERIEPELQTFDGQSWVSHDLRYKPGDPLRPPPFVAPHQPRVDFLLWFHGLSHRQLPDYVRGLLRRACHDPSAVSELFVRPLPENASAVRMLYQRYHFTSPAERGQSGAWWTRTPVASSPAFSCTTLPR